MIVAQVYPLLNVTIVTLACDKRAGARCGATGALGMGWITRHKRYGIVLALIAVALQIVLAFDHVHLPGLVKNSHSAAITQRVAKSQTLPQAPAPIDDDRFCAICASIFLASTALTAPQQQLPLPASFQRVEHSLNANSVLAERPRLAFRSRAPPVA